METVADFIQLTEAMRSELKQQVITVRRLAVAFAESDLHMNQHDQAANLRILKARVTKEVDDVKRTEVAAQMGYTEGTLISSGVEFLIGSLLTAAVGHKDAAHAGAKMANASLSQKAPFGSVIIAISKKGIPEGVEVVPVSRIARETSRSEPEVEADLRKDGYLLTTPEQFSKLLDKVEQALLEGSVCLPLARSEVIKQLTK